MDDEAQAAGDATSQGRMASSAAWPVFEARLAETLETLEEDQYLVISSKRGWAYVQFAAQGSFGLRAESVSNNYLFGSNRLSADQIEALRTLGWSPPTGTPQEATPKRQPDGSPNFFRDFGRPVPFGDVARLAVRTLTEVLGIPHPGFLKYKAFDRNHQSILIPTLGLMRCPPAPRQEKPPADTVGEVRVLLLEAIRKASGIPDLEFSDENNLLPLRFGTAMVLVRVHREPFCVGIISPILANVEVNDVLVDRLNDINAKVRFARLFVTEGTVYAAVEVSASPFVADHVVRACELLGRLADDLDESLQEQFGGRTAFGEFRFKTSVH
jgi:hypothetical protein